MKKIAIIGGTGVYSPDLFRNSEILTVNTPYGDVNLFKAEYNKNIVYFLERHGKGHKNAPHTVNYRANIWALKELSADRVLATAAVGSIYKEISPGSLVIIDQFIDFTKSRPATFFDGSNGVVHIDMSEPYCPELRENLIQCCKNLKLSFFDKGTYVCTEGPRFETAAEIKMFKLLGGHVVGMTNCPEVVLAREANLCYAAVAIVTNYCTGISENALTHKEVMDNMSAMSENVGQLFLNSIDTISIDKKCSCSSAAKELGSLK